MEKVRESALKHAIVNAHEHQGDAQEKAVLGKVIADHPDVKSKIKEVKGIVQSVVKDVNSWDTGKLEEEYNKLDIEPEEKKEGGLPELPNAEKGKVVMRMAPYPSGPLHIGNARMVVLNDEYVKRYGGKLLLVYDDTIGSEEKKLSEDAYDMIKEGLEWLGVKIDEVYYKSDRMELFYDYAERMLKEDMAYVCMCPAEELRRGRKMGIACDHRSHIVEENLELWEKMLEGGFDEGEAIVRLKTDMEHPNPAFRDRVLLRICDRSHPKVGNKYHVWPMLEFSWAVDDHELGMTHILRGKDLVMEDEMEIFIWKKFGFDIPEFLHYGMLKLEDVKLSKSKARVAIKSGNFSGWGDPRTWSLQSLEKRGIHPDAIRQFIINMGMSLSDVTVPAEILYAENRKIIDEKATRYFAVFDPMKISVSVKKEFEVKSTKAQLHPDFPERGNREIPVNSDEIYVEKEDYKRLKGKRVGLMNLYTVKLGKEADFDSEEVDMDVQKIHWVSEKHVEVDVVMPDGEVEKVLVEPDIVKEDVGNLVQLVRVGFCRVDKAKKDIVLYFAHK